MILVGATWMGLYLRSALPARCRCWRRRPTRSAPGISIIASSRNARRVRLAHRSVQPHGVGAVGEPPRLERSSIDLERKHQDVEDAGATSRRFSSGLPPASSRSMPGRISTVNAAACACSGSGPRVGRPAVDGVRSRGSRSRSRWSITRRAPTRPSPQEGRDRPRRPRAAPRGDGDGAAARRRSSDGMVLVFDDVTPLIRAQKVAAWRGGGARGSPTRSRIR